MIRLTFKQKMIIMVSAVINAENNFIIPFESVIIYCKVF